MTAKTGISLSLGLLLMAISCNPGSPVDQREGLNNIPMDTAANKIQINRMLDSFNLAAAQADYAGYFNYFTDDALFIGTDATEHWDKKAFMIWAKPYFDHKKTWKFKSLKRSIYFGRNPDIAWFDELLSTQMKICRGSGVVVKVNNEWKVQQYVLSVTVPNEDIDAIIQIKAPKEDSLIEQLSTQP